MIKFKDFLTEMAYKRMGSGKTPFTENNGPIIIEGNCSVSNYIDPGEIDMLKGNENPLLLVAELSRKHPLDNCEE